MIQPKESLYTSMMKGSGSEARFNESLNLIYCNHICFATKDVAVFYVFSATLVWKIFEAI